MNKSFQAEPLPYVTEAPLLVKIITLLLLAWFPWIIFSPDTFVNSWNETNVIGKLCVLLTTLAIPYFVLIVFLTKTVFKADSITNVNLLLVKKQFPYSDIKEIEVTPDYDISLKMVDGTSIKIRCGTDYIKTPLKILKLKLGNSFSERPLNR
jgi:hypothetical protein